MPVKLTGKEHKVIATALAVSAVALGISVKYFWRAFPEASIDFRLNRNDSQPLAEKFLADRGLRLEAYRHAAIFDYSEETKLYLERTQGLDRMNQLTRGPIRLWRWSHRWFKPQQKEEFRVDVTPAGDVVGFDHEIPESAPGANLEPAAARALAEKSLREVMKRDLADLEFVETETEKRPARTDHSFTWKQKSLNLGDGSLRVEVEVDGDRVAGYREYVKIPEQWARDYEKMRSRNISAQMVDQVFWALLTVAMIVILVRRLRDHDVPVRLSVGFGLVAAVLVFLGQLNDFSVAEFGYQTTDPYSSHVVGYIQRSVLSALAAGTGIFLLVAGSEPVYRESFPGLISFRRYLSWQGLRTRSFFMANVVGIALTFFFFAYQTVFYLTANKLGAWAPADVNYSDLLNTRIPWVWVLFSGFFPAVSEETQFRAFAIPFLKKVVRSWPLALVLAAFNWGFLHSAYPNQPFFIRGLEVGLGGIVTGLVMLRFGIVATLIWHYSVDALYTAFLLLRSHNHYLMVSGAVTAGIMLIPLITVLLAYWLAGTFAEEEALTNAKEGVRRASRQEAVREMEAPLAYRPLEKSRLMLACFLTAVLMALALVPAYRFGKGIKLQTSRQDAIRLAEDFLKARQVPAEGYLRAAWLRENVDPLALRYLLERRSVEESDRIYREATRLVLWEVRYFRPLQKEEHLVFVDAAGGKVFAYRHLLDENAPGASLSPDQARKLAEEALEQHGYRVADFELQESQGRKRKARQDYTLVWQAKSGDPRNVGDAHYRLEVNIAGDQVVGLSRFFKVPEEWERQRVATRLSNTILRGIVFLLLAGFVGAGLILFVRQLRSGKIPWRASFKVGAALAALLVFSELNELPLFYREYDTSIPLAGFRLSLASGLVILPLLAGLAGSVLVGLATSLYPEAWLIFRGMARRAWRRDAMVAIVVSLVAGVAMSRVGLLLASRFHSYMPVRIDLFPDMVSTLSPGAGFFFQGLLWSVFYAGLAALAVYASRLGMTGRPWWFWAGGLLVLAALGPTRAHSVPEFVLSWTMNFVTLIVALGIVALFFRNNVLAYVGAALALHVAEPLVTFLSQPTLFYRLNGLLLAALTAIVLGWMLVPSGERSLARGPSG
jgi:membrane protease YdiL (CAAX protease family)